MSEVLTGPFVKEETLARPTGVVALNLRLFGQLSLFLKILPLSILTILLSSAAPSIYRWYSAKFSSAAGAVDLFHSGVLLRFSLTGLAWLTALGVFFRVSAWASFELSGMWSAQDIHSRMVSAMSATRTTFFDENPSGRLINRLVRDFDELRLNGIIFVGDLLNVIVELASIAVVASLASPWASLLMVPLLFGFVYMQFHRSQMLDHARGLSAIALGRVISRKTDLIEGREIFLLYGRSGHLLTRMSESFRVYVQASALTFSLAVLVFLSFAVSSGKMSATLTGVIISALFGVTGSIGWLDFVSGMISRAASHIRRVFEFVDLPTEEEEERAPGLPVFAQKTQVLGGDIEFKNFTMSYRQDTPVILDGLNVRIAQGSKVAWVGRTGSGKTSLFQSLLRMVYVRQGEVFIGGQSIYGADLRAHRALFGVVPQSPYLFAGTLRSNLDRTLNLTDHVLEKALSLVGLEYKLNQAVAEGGNNFSLGERQLICLARVLAVGRPIVLMDEPTSGLDPKTDARMSAVLRHAFEGRTLLTIAHRRESLGNYDWIIELKDGKILRQGKPGALVIAQEEMG